MTYNEYGQVLDAGIKPEDLVTFKYEDQGVATLEDGLYVLEPELQDPAMVDKLVRFVRASMKGWKYAEEHPDEAAEIILENDETGAQTLAHQRFMVGEVGKLTAGSNGALDHGRLPAHGRHAAGRRLGPGDFQGTRRGLDPRHHRQGVELTQLRHRDAPGPDAGPGACLRGGPADKA